MKLLKTFAIVLSTMLYANVYSGVVNIPGGSGGFHVWQPRTNAVTQGAYNVITEGEDLEITVLLRDAGDHARPKPAQLGEGGSFVSLAVSESGQSTYRVDLIRDGYYGLYIPVGQRQGTLRIPTNANNYPNSASSVSIALRTEGWGISTVETSPVTIRIADNTTNQPEGNIEINFCPGMATEVREGEDYQISVCLDRAAPIPITSTLIVLSEEGKSTIIDDIAYDSKDFTIPARTTRLDIPPSVIAAAYVEGDEVMDTRLLHKSWHVVVTQAPAFSVARAWRSSPSSLSLLFIDRIALPAGRMMRPAR